MRRFTWTGAEWTGKVKVVGGILTYVWLPQVPLYPQTFKFWDLKSCRSGAVGLNLLQHWQISCIMHPCDIFPFNHFTPHMGMFGSKSSTACTMALHILRLPWFKSRPLWRASWGWGPCDFGRHVRTLGRYKHYPVEPEGNERIWSWRWTNENPCFGSTSFGALIATFIPPATKWAANELMTFEGLHSVAQCCPKLEGLEVRFDARNVVEHSGI